MKRDQDRDIIRIRDLKKETANYCGEDRPTLTAHAGLGDVSVRPEIVVGTGIPGIDQSQPVSRAEESDIHGHDVGAFGVGPGVSGSDER